MKKILAALLAFALLLFLFPFLLVSLFAAVAVFCEFLEDRV